MSEHDTKNPESQLAVPFDELKLRIDSQLILNSLDQSERYIVRLIGYSVNQSVIVSTPKVEGKQLILKKDRPFKVSSMAKKEAFAFQTSVKAVMLQPYPHIHLDYPKEMFTVQVRNSSRLNVNIPVTVVNESKVNSEGSDQAHLVNLSRTGAGLQSDESIGKEGDTIVIKFAIRVAEVSKYIKLAATIRNKRAEETKGLPIKYSYGLQFAEMSDSAKIVLSAFINEMQAQE